MPRKIFRWWRGGFVGKDGCTKLCPPLNVVVVTEETSKMIMNGRIVLEGDDVCGWLLGIGRRHGFCTRCRGRDGFKYLERGLLSSFGFHGFSSVHTIGVNTLFAFLMREKREKRKGGFRVNVTSSLPKNVTEPAGISWNCVHVKSSPAPATTNALTSHTNTPTNNQLQHPLQLQRCAVDFTTSLERA